MAHPAGFEPTTPAFGGQYSIQMSYGCTSENFIWQKDVAQTNSHDFSLIKVNRLFQRF